MAAQEEVRPVTVYELQEHDHLRETDTQVSEVKTKIAEIEADRQRRRNEATAWRKDFDREREALAKDLQVISDRLTRVETFGTAALVIIGVLNSLGLVRRLKGAEAKAESIASSIFET
jgi:hypothetical protein